MNLDQISSRIAAPDSCLGQEIPALKELTEKYPFAQVFSILYLKALSGQHAVGFDEALQEHAYRITDRMKLYDLIHPVTDDSDQIANTDGITIDRDAIHGVSTETEMHGVSTEIELLEPEPLETNLLELKSSESDLSEIKLPELELIEIRQSEIQPSEIIPSETEPSPVESISQYDDKPQPDQIDDLGAISEDVGTEENTDSTEEVSVPDFAVDFIRDEVELEIISQVVANVYNDNLENSIPERPVEEKKSEVDQIEEPTPEKQQIETPRSFSSWLRAGNQVAGTKAPEPAKESVQSTEVIEKQIDKIIERFIEKEPSISRPKKEFYSPTKKAKESINPEGLIYTETLANIFAIQGNFPKAILAYEQLMLTNPEKKIFFALRIQELKEKLNT